MNPATVRSNLRTIGDEYVLEYGDIEVSCSVGPETAFIGHFELPPEQRGQGTGSTIMRVFLNILRDDGVEYVEARIAVTESDTLDDPTVDFLQKHGFSDFQFKDHPDWGYVVRAGQNL